MKAQFALVVLVVAILFPSFCSADEIPIPRSVPGDKGKYYLVEMKKNGELITALHKRVGVMETGHTRTEINCRSKQYRELAYGESGPEKLKPMTSKWTDTLAGSSKSDLVEFVCARAK